MHPGKRTTWDRVAWHPDGRASLGLAAAATLLVMTGFAVLFSAAPNLKLSRDVDRVREQLVLAEPVPAPPPPPHPRASRPAAAHPVPLLQSAWPPLLAPISTPGGFTAQDYLDELRQQDGAALRGQVTGSELKRDLGKQTEKPAISDNQSYRTIDGQRVERGGGCAESQTQQGSSSPTNHFEVARPISCPGDPPDASQQMSKSLDDWAKKVQQSQAPPP